MAALIVVYWEWTEGAHKGARFWASHNVENDGRLRDWPQQGMRPLGASVVEVIEGVGLDLIERDCLAKTEAKGNSDV